MPTVLILFEHVSQFVGIAHDVWSYFLEESDEAGAAGSSIEPEGEWGGIWIGFGLYEHVMNLSSWLVGVEVAGVDGDIRHALRGGRDTMGAETLSS